MNIKVDHVLDAKGLACPMPIVKTKKQIKQLRPGEVIEIQATDQGSKADIVAWAKSTGELLKKKVLYTIICVNQNPKK